MNVSQANRPLWLGCAADGGDQQALMQHAQIEASVEAIAERGKVASRVFTEIKRMVATGQADLEVTQKGIDPLELRDLLGLAPCRR